MSNGEPFTYNLIVFGTQSRFQPARIDPLLDSERVFLLDGFKMLDGVMLPHRWLEANGFTPASFFGGQQAPNLAGVYVFACFKHIWYVGSSVNLRLRLRHHNLRTVIPDLCSVWWMATELHQQQERTLILELDPILNIRFGRGAFYRKRLDLVQAFPESFIGGHVRRKAGVL